MATPQEIEQQRLAAEEAAKAAIAAVQDPETPPAEEPPAEEPPLEVNVETPGSEEDFLNMPDDKFEKLEEPADIVPAEEDPDKEEQVKAEGEDGESDPEGGEKDPVKAEGTPPGEEPKGDEQPPEGEPAKPEKVEAAKEPEKEPASAKEPAPAKENEITDTQRISGFNDLMAPFKANGRDVQVQSVEEARRLMQMGAGHIKYQQQVRPQLAVAQTLKNSGVDNDRLNFLIELHNGNKDAIQKLVRDSGLDPYEIKTDDEAKAADKDYRPKDYAVSDSAVTLEQTVASVGSTDDGAKLLSDIRSNWDDGSRQSLLEDPGILSVLSDQKHSGIYDQITAEIDRQRTLGGLNGVSFLKAYHQVGTEMEQRGAFKKEPEPVPDGSTTETALKETPKESKIIATETAKPKPEAGGDPSAVAAPKPGTPAKAAPDNFMDMSDEEFAKFEAQFA